MTRRGPYWLDPTDRGFAFPPTRHALRDPNGLLAIGGDLSPGRLLTAYRQGIFPWFSEGQPILWWTPDPRSVLFPSELRVSRSLAKTVRRGRFRVTMDQAFPQVMAACAAPRGDGLGTWITPEMHHAYVTLHRLGYAHSVESWQDGELVGGLYGVAIGRVFFGESMFTRRTDASKVAFVHLVRQLIAWKFGLIDCQVSTAHLESLGARSIPRAQFESLLDLFAEEPGLPGPWRFTPGEATP
ncbi:MAG: leucyl/phenylalanyl-tRNA--protein transferase [Thiohalomonadaceae bacterium]